MGKGLPFSHLAVIRLPHIGGLKELWGKVSRGSHSRPGLRVVLLVL